jgi:hypothetical protein
VEIVRFQVLTAASMMFRIVFWDVLPGMMEAVHTSETSVDNYFTRQYIPKDNSIYVEIDFMCESYSFQNMAVGRYVSCQILYFTVWFLIYILKYQSLCGVVSAGSG